MKTAYIPKNEAAEKAMLESINVTDGFKPIQIADDGEQLYKRIELSDSTMNRFRVKYEPVSIEVKDQKEISDDNEGLKNTLKVEQMENSDLHKENQELKKQVPRWEKFDGMRHGEVVTIDFNGVMHLGGSLSDTEWFIPLPPRPQKQPDNDPAEEAWEKSAIRQSFMDDNLQGFDETKNAWMKDFQAASQKEDR